MNVWVKRIGCILAVPFLLVLLLSVMLYVPVVQDWAVRQATRYASQATGMQIHIERIRLSFPLRLNVHGVEVVQAEADTLLSLGDLDVHVRPWPLFSQEVLVEAIQLSDMHVDTRELLDGLTIKGHIHELYAHADRISLASERATLNQFSLSDAAVTLLLTDTTSQPDTVTTAPLHWILSLEQIELKRVAVALQMPLDTLQMAGFIADARLQEGLVDLGQAH